MGVAVPHASREGLGTGLEEWIDGSDLEGPDESAVVGRESDGGSVGALCDLEGGDFLLGLEVDPLEGDLVGVSDEGEGGDVEGGGVGLAEDVGARKVDGGRLTG